MASHGGVKRQIKAPLRAYFSFLWCLFSASQRAKGCVPVFVFLLSIRHKMIDNIAEGHVRKCGSTTGIEGGRERLSVPWKSHQVSPHPPTSLLAPPHFQLSALFSRIIDGACEVQRTGMKMPQSQGCKTRAMAKGGAEQRTTHAVFIAVFNMRRDRVKNGVTYISPYTALTVLAAMDEVNVAITCHKYAEFQGEHSQCIMKFPRAKAES